MCDIGWSGWIATLIYLLFFGAFGFGTLFGVGVIVWNVVKKISGPSKLP
jgi:hypothetical protein